MEMLNPWEEVFQNCELIIDPVTECIIKKHGRQVVILLAGGDKNTQTKDIKTALRLAQNL